MTKRVSHISGIGATLLALAATASADIKLNDNFTLSGYAAGSYEYTSKTGPYGEGSSDSLFNGQKDTPSADAVKTALTYNFKPVTAVVSLYYVPNLPTNELTVLDAYVTYDTGTGVTVTAGKFLSWLGYEAFDTSNMAQITYGTPTVGGLGAVPAYHSGVKVEYGDKAYGAGFALLDSAYPAAGTFARGDGELKHNAGFEGYFTYKGIEGLQLWGGFAYDTKGAEFTYQQYHSTLTGDVWVQYTVNKQITVAAEVTDKDGMTANGTALKGWDWLVFGSYTIDDKWSVIGRVSGESPSGSTRRDTGLSGYTQYTIGPSYNVTPNLIVRAEYSYYSYRANSVNEFDEEGPVNVPSWDKNFFGVQFLFKF